jgi:hypothetical protein
MKKTVTIPRDFAEQLVTLLNRGGQLIDEASRFTSSSGGNQFQMLSARLDAILNGRGHEYSMYAPVTRARIQ